MWSFFLIFFSICPRKLSNIERQGNHSWVDWGEQSDWKDKKAFNKLYKPPPPSPPPPPPPSPPTPPNTYLVQCTEKSDANVSYWQIEEEVVGDSSHTWVDQKIRTLSQIVSPHCSVHCRFDNDQIVWGRENRTPLLNLFWHFPTELLTFHDGI